MYFFLSEETSRVEHFVNFSPQVNVGVWSKEETGAILEVSAIPRNRFVTIGASEASETQQLVDTQVLLIKNHPRVYSCQDSERPSDYLTKDPENHPPRQYFEPRALASPR